MFRRIWHRAAALAVPVMVAICIPPLAVIALNLHAESPAAARQPRTTTRATAALPKAAKIRLAEKQHQVRRKPQEGPAQQENLTVRN